MRNRPKRRKLQEAKEEMIRDSHLHEEEIPEFNCKKNNRIRNRNFIDLSFNMTGPMERQGQMRKCGSLWSLTLVMTRGPFREVSQITLSTPLQELDLTLTTLGAIKHLHIQLEIA